MQTFQPPALANTCVRIFSAAQANPYSVGEAWNAADLKQAWQDLLPQLLSWQRLDTDHYGIVAGPWAQVIADIISTDTQPEEGNQHE